jgi:APA family basic amino acid/polyamine antiporter
MGSQEILPPQNGAASPADAQLVRVIGPWGLWATAVNGTIGAGIFVLPGLVAAILGPSAIIAYLICGLAVALVLTCFIEIGSFVRRSGGAVAYVEEAFGPMIGFLAWLLYSVGFTIFACAALGAVLMDTLALGWPAIGHGAARIIALFVLFGGLAAVNIVGVRQGLRLTVATTIAKLLPLFFVIAAGFVVMHWRELRWSGWPSTAKLGEASLLLFFAFQGSEDALTPSGEIRDPARTVPRAMFSAMGTLICIYIAAQVVCQGTLGSGLAQQPTAPLAAVAGRAIGTAGRTLIMAGLSLSIFGVLAGRLMTTPRAFFLIAQNGTIPVALARVHPRFRTPYVAIVTVAVLMFLLSASGEFQRLAVYSSVCMLCVYLAICLAALRLRYTRQQAPGAFRARGGPTVGILGAVVIMWLLSHSTWTQMGALAGAVVLAIAYYYARRGFLSRRGKTIR